MRLWIQDKTKQKSSVIMSTHEYEFTQNICQKIIILKKGKVVCQKIYSKKDLWKIDLEKTLKPNKHDDSFIEDYQSYLVKVLNSDIHRYIFNDYEQAQSFFLKTIDSEYKVNSFLRISSFGGDISDLQQYFIEDETNASL